MKVLFLSSWFPSRVHPTLGNFVQAHAEAAALFHDVTVLYIAKDEHLLAIEIEESIENKLRIVRVYYPAKFGKIAGRYRAFRAGIKFLGLKKGSFHIAQLNMIWNEGWQAMYLKRKFGLEYVISDNWTGYHPDQRGTLSTYIKMYMRMVANQSALLVPVTLQLERAMRNLGFKPDSMIVPNTVAVETFSISHFSNQKMRFLHVSHLDQKHKNIFGILSVWKQFSDEFKDVELHIGGDGPWENIALEADRLNIRKDSLFSFGPQNREGVAKLMKNSDCLVLFSNYENLPLVIVEAMACGLTIIAADVGGISEHIANHPFHKLIEKKNESQLLQALIESRIERKAVDHLSIRQYAIDHFSMDAVGRAFTQAYTKALSQK